MRMAELSRAEQARLNRRAIIEMSGRRQRPGTGSNLPRTGAPLRTWPDLREILAGIPWAVVGGVATRAYMPERATQDFDIAILSSDATSVAARLRGAGYTYHGPLSIPGDTWMAPDGTPVDVLEQGEGWWKEALAEAASNLDEGGAPILPLPFLVVMKFLAGRSSDFWDISRMMVYATDDEIDAVRAAVARLTPPDLEDLESLVKQGRLERPDRA
jgi:hypothetical protein